MGEQVKGSERLDRPAVLVADDDEDLRELFILLFEEFGYTVITASDGESTLACLRTYPTALIVLLDWWMPGLDGFAVLQAMAANPSLAQRHSYFLFTIRHEAARPLLAALPAHLAVMLVSKPVDIFDLRRLVEGAAARLRDRHHEFAQLSVGDGDGESQGESQGMDNSGLQSPPGCASEFCRVVEEREAA
jgi:CheY-like chemotaxis protein